LGGDENSNQKIQSLENDMNDIKNEIGNLNEKISTLEENYDNLKKDVDEILNNLKNQSKNNNNNQNESENNNENKNNENKNDENNNNNDKNEDEKISGQKTISDFSINKTIMNHQDKVMSIKVLRDGRLISSSYDKLINIYDEKSYKLVLSIKEHTGWVFYV